MNILLENSRHIKHYGFMADIFDVLEGVCEEYDWFVSDIETNCKPPEQLQGSQVFIEGERLKRTLKENHVQFIWAVFSAYPKGSKPFVQEVPYADGNPCFWEGSPKPQLSGASFEIVCWDSSLYLLTRISHEHCVNFENNSKIQVISKLSIIRENLHNVHQRSV